MTKNPWKRRYAKWHRALGISSALFVVVLSVSGVLLNHSHDLNLEQKPVKSAWLLSAYGVKIPAVRAFSLETGTVEQVGTQLSLNGDTVTQCDGKLLHAQTWQDFYLLACERELLLLTRSGELIERLGPMHGLPSPLIAADQCGRDVCVQTKDGSFRADATLSTFSPSETSIAATLPVEPSQSVRAKVLASYVGTDLTWARVVQDIHAGRFFGKLGPWIMDFVALLFLLLSVSGVYLWWQGSQKKR